MDGSVNIVGGDRHDVASGAPKSPWKTSTSPSPMLVPDSDSWPALSDTQRRVKNNGNVRTEPAQFPTPLSPRQAIVPLAASLTQTAVEQQKFPGRGYSRSQRRPFMNHNINGFKHKSNGAPPFPVPIQYFQPAFPPFYHAPVPTSVPTPAGYPYEFPSVPYARGDAQPFLPSGTGGFRPMVVHPHPRFGIHDSLHTVGMASQKEHGGLVAPSWHRQQPVAYNDIYLQQNMRSRPFVRPPSFMAMGHARGTPGAVYHYTALHTGVVRSPYQPYYVPSPVSTRVAMPPSLTADLRAVLVKQIEYYFCDQNLQGDAYLISLMDDEGWVPISCIADFNRVKRMNVGISFILDALRVSETIEIQGEKIRSRGEWFKWVQSSKISKSSSLDGSTVKSDDSDESRRHDSREQRDFPVESLPPSADTVSELDNPILMSSSSQHITDLQAETAEELELVGDRSISNVDDLSADFSSTFVLDEDDETDTQRSNRGCLYNTRTVSFCMSACLPNSC